MRRNVESAPHASPVDAHERTRDYLSEEEFAVLLQGTPRSRYRWRNAAMLMLTFYHGLRVTELCRLKRQDVDLTHGRIWIKRIKGSLSTEQPLQADELRTLKRYLTQRGNAQLPWLFLNERGDQFTRSSINYLVGITGVRAGLQFLFNAMAPKADERFPFGGRPASLYADNGPVTRSHVFHQVMDYLGIEVKTHLPRGPDGRRTTARAKGKVERPFRTVKEAHETLYHFHEPQTEAEANAWLFNYLLRYNDSPHRSAAHSRMEDWVQHLPPEGLREMCSWERFCAFAREPETRKVAVDAQVSVSGVRYEVDPDLAGETVTLWFGLYDDQLFVEHGERRYGPYAPSGGPIPLHRYRSFKKTPTQKRADRIEGLAEQLSMPRAALSDYPTLSSSLSAFEAVQQPFADPDPFHQLTFPNTLDAKRAIADHLGMPLAKLSPEQLSSPQYPAGCNLGEDDGLGPCAASPRSFL